MLNLEGVPQVAAHRGMAESIGRDGERVVEVSIKKSFTDPSFHSVILRKKTIFVVNFQIMFSALHLFQEKIPVRTTRHFLVSDSGPPQS